MVHGHKKSVHSCRLLFGGYSLLWEQTNRNVNWDHLCIKEVRLFVLFVMLRFLKTMMSLAALVVILEAS
jgi:hypothetical protein